MLEEKTYKNWNEICKTMGWKTAGGNTKKKRLEELRRMCDFTREGNKYIINKIYETPKIRTDKRNSSIDKCGNLKQLLPELGKILLEEDNQGNFKLTTKSFTRTSLLKELYDLNTNIEESYVHKIFNMFYNMDYCRKQGSINRFSTKLNSFFWDTKVKKGALDKIEKFDLGKVEETRKIRIVTKDNNLEDDGIEEKVRHRDLTEEELRKIKISTDSMCKRLGKKSIVLFSNEEKKEYYEVISNLLGEEGEVIMYTSYRITLNDLIDGITSKEYKDTLFKEFYKKHCAHLIDEDFDEFMIFTTLFNMLYVGKQALDLAPYDEEQKEKYEKEIRRLNEEIKEKDKRIAELEEENRRLREGLK